MDLPPLRSTELIFGRSSLKVIIGEDAAGLDHGPLHIAGKAWPAANVFAEYVAETYPIGRCEVLNEAVARRHQGTADDVCHILELGAGTGVAGIALAKLLAHHRDDATARHRFHVTITDLEFAVPLIAKNIGDNQLDESLASAKRLEWGVLADARAISPAPSLIFATDVVYYTHLFEPLINTLLHLTSPCREGDGRTPLVFLVCRIREPGRETPFYTRLGKYFKIEALDWNGFWSRWRDEGFVMLLLDRRASGDEVIGDGSEDFEALLQSWSTLTY